MLLNTKLLDEIVERALMEDVGTGDVTTLSTVPADATTEGYIYAKENGVLAGIFVAQRVFQILDPGITFEDRKVDGDQIVDADILAVVLGPARTILTGERVALNLLQRMSGIATRTARLNELLKGYKTEVVDTRKTLPGLRMLEKYAVRVGGGKNHRFGLYDGVLIKDNHIKIAGGVKSAVALAKAEAPHTMKIEVEVENLVGVNEALKAGADIIMLDNMDPADVQEAVKIVNRRALVEVSGGISEDNVVEYAKAGVDLISVGALTHSVKALDISLDIQKIKVRSVTR